MVFFTHFYTGFQSTHSDLSTLINTAIHSMYSFLLFTYKAKHKAIKCLFKLQLCHFIWKLLLSVNALKVSGILSLFWRLVLGWKSYHPAHLEQCCAPGAVAVSMGLLVEDDWIAQGDSNHGYEAHQDAETVDFIPKPTLIDNCLCPFPDSVLGKDLVSLFLLFHLLFITRTTTVKLLSWRRSPACNNMVFSLL